MQFHRWLGKTSALRSKTRSFRRTIRIFVKSFIAKRVRRARKATFIGITGSSAKSTTTALLSHILSGHGEVHSQVFSNTMTPIAKAVSSTAPSADFVVVETGVSAKNQMATIAKVIQPDVAIITLIGLEHYSAFRSKQVVAEEKGFLVEAIKPGGFAVLNADDEYAMAMAARTSQRIVTFGRDLAADFRCVSASSQYPKPLSVEIAWRGGREKIVSRLVGEHFWLTIAAAFATAVELGVDITTILERCADFEPIPNRCQPVPIEKGPVFIVDTVKAPWHSLPLALQIIETAIAPRKRIVLGNLSDMTSSSQKYRDAYRMVRRVSDEVVFVGVHSHRSKATQEDRKNGHFVEATGIMDVHQHIMRTAVENEIILLKGSQSQHLERVALGWKYEVKCWVDNCGKLESCHQCGLFEYPFEQHGKISRKRKRELRRKIDLAPKVPPLFL